MAWRLTTIQHERDVKFDFHTGRDVVFGDAALRELAATAAGRTTCLRRESGRARGVLPAARDGPDTARRTARAPAPLGSTTTRMQLRPTRSGVRRDGRRARQRGFTRNAGFVPRACASHPSRLAVVAELAHVRWVAVRTTHPVPVREQVAVVGKQLVVHVVVRGRPHAYGRPTSPRGGASPSGSDRASSRRASRRPCSSRRCSGLLISW